MFIHHIRSGVDSVCSTFELSHALHHNSIPVKLLINPQCSFLRSQAMFGELSWPVTILTIFYSLAGLGIAIVNDFKSIEGDA